MCYWQPKLMCHVEIIKHATALHWAAHDGHNDILKALLAANADASLKKSDGAIALRWVAAFGHVAVVKTLLKADLSLVSAAA